MRKAYLASIAALTCIAFAYTGAPEGDATRPHYEGGKLVRPEG